MPRYIVERSFGAISEEEMLTLASRADTVMQERFPGITWEHSHICVGPDGSISSFCVYTAPSADVVREHAGLIGGHSITNVQEIAEDITPQEVRRRVAG